MFQFLAGVLEPKHEQEEEHTDLGADMDEAGADVQRSQAALAEGETAEKIKRNGRDAPAAGETRENSQAKNNQTQLDQQARDVVRQGGHALGTIPHSR